MFIYTLMNDVDEICRVNAERFDSETREDEMNKKRMYENL